MKDSKSPLVEDAIAAFSRLALGDRPIRLLRGVEGLEYTPMEGAYPCCGFGGTFAMKNAEVSSAMLDVSFEMGFSNAQASNRLTSRGPAA